MFSSPPRLELDLDLVASIFVLKFPLNSPGRQIGMALKHVKAVRADGGEQVVQSLRGMHVVRNQVIYLVVGETALCICCINEFRNVVKSQTESFSAATCMEQRLIISSKSTTIRDP
jgi:hypothetical protein